MKRNLKKICLTIAVSLLASQPIFATTPVSAKKLSFGKSEFNIHFTHIKLIKHKTINVDGMLYLGDKRNGSCQKVSRIADLHDEMADGTVIETPAYVFEGGSVLTQDSCAIEEFTAEGKTSSVSYNLINDGESVIMADPVEQMVTLD